MPFPDRRNPARVNDSDFVTFREHYALARRVDDIKIDLGGQINLVIGDQQHDRAAHYNLRSQINSIMEYLSKDVGQLHGECKKVIAIAEEERNKKTRQEFIFSMTSMANILMLVVCAIVIYLSRH